MVVGVLVGVAVGVVVDVGGVVVAPSVGGGDLWPVGDGEDVGRGASVVGEGCGVSVGAGVGVRTLADVVGTETFCGDGGRTHT